MLTPGFVWGDTGLPFAAWCPVHDALHYLANFSVALLLCHAICPYINCDMADAQLCGCHILLIDAL